MAEEGTIGRYRLLERVGTGAFATVWRGYDDELDAPVAIKVLADNWSHDADVRARFVAEARLLRRVRDQRVVRVHDIGTLPDGRPYFVMDYADGGTVAALTEDGQRTAPVEGLRLGAEIARAVQVLHDHGVAHRDIKPQNLLLTSLIGGADSDRQGVVVADLGMAKSLSEASGYTVTAGTPAYMAPEQALGLGFDQRADVYAVAAVTYTLLAGRPPFAGSGIVEIAERSRASSPPPLRTDPRGLVDAVLAAALSFDPDQRPGSAGELAAHLDRIADGLTGSDAVTVLQSPGDWSPPGFARSAPSPSAWSAATPPVHSAATPPARSAATPVAAYATTPAPLAFSPATASPALASTRPRAAVAAPRRTSTAGVLVGAVALAVLVAAVTWLLLTLYA